MPVSCLNTFVTDWTIKVKILKKYEPRNWNNARGSGTLMNIDLMDKQGCQIQATFFGDCVQQYNSMLEEGKVYTMSNGQVKMANKRFTTIPNDHSLTFDHFAKI